MARSTRRAIGMTTHGSTGRHDAAEADGGAQVPGQEARGLSRATCSRLCPATPEVLGAHDAVDEADGEVESVRVLQHAGEALGGGIGRDVGALGEPAAHEGDDVVGARREIRGGVRHGHEASVLLCGRAEGVARLSGSVCDATSVRYSE